MQFYYVIITTYNYNFLLILHSVFISYFICNSVTSFPCCICNLNSFNNCITKGVLVNYHIIYEFVGNGNSNTDMPSPLNVSNHPV